MPRADNGDLDKQLSVNLQLLNNESKQIRCNLKFYKNICILLGISTIITVSNILITNYIINGKHENEYGSCSC